MLHQKNRRVWLRGWLRGMAVAVEAERARPAALATAIGRALREGLTDRQVADEIERVSKRKTGNRSAIACGVGHELLNLVGDPTTYESTRLTGQNRSYPNRVGLESDPT